MADFGAIHEVCNSAAFFCDISLDAMGWMVGGRQRWCLVPLPAIQQAIKLIRSGEIENARYDLETATVEVIRTKWTS